MGISFLSNFTESAKAALTIIGAIKLVSSIWRAFFGVISWIEAFLNIAAEFTVPLAWQDGDVALVDNHRVMHGRHPYSGQRKREVVVCLARDA